MANYNEQVLMAWTEWESQTGNPANNPDDFLEWALENEKLAPQPQDIRQILRRRITTALRHEHRVDEWGVVYRAKQCVVNWEKGQQIPLWFDIDSGGTPNLRKKAARQRRDGIANDVYRAMCDVEHMNNKFKEEIQFEMDFNEDYHERKLAEELDILDKDLA